MATVLVIATMVILAAGCLTIQIYLVATRKISTPHQVFELAKTGHPLAKICARMYWFSVGLFLVLVILQLVLR
jgi:hypothetical protein